MRLGLEPLHPNSRDVTSFVKRCGLHWSESEQAKELAQRALRGLAGFAKALKVKYQDIEVGMAFEPVRSNVGLVFESGAMQPRLAGERQGRFPRQ